jgi:peptide subunit release factor RF-3
MPMREILAFPASTLLRFFANHGLLTLADRPAWRTVRGARWVEADDHRELERIEAAHHGAIADDWSGAPVFLAVNPSRLKIAEEDWPKIRFRTTREHAE